MFGLKGTELLIILVLVLVLFGGGRVATLGSDLGKGIRNFKRGFSGEDDASPNPQNLTSNNSTDNRGPATRTPSNATKDV